MRGTVLIVITLEESVAHLSYVRSQFTQVGNSFANFKGEEKFLKIELGLGSLQISPNEILISLWTILHTVFFPS